jgi:YidC/Oxa1 family membrane protein insertase
MDFDKKTILAFLLIGLILIFAQSPLYQKIFFPNIYNAKRIQKEIQLKNLQTEINTPVTPEIQAPQIVQPPILQKQEQIKSNIPEKIIEIDGKLFHAVLSTKGASLLEWTLKAFPGADGIPVQCLPQNVNGTLGISFTTKDGDTLDTSNLNFDTLNKSNIILINNNSDSIQFICNLQSNIRLVKKFIFNNESYDFKMTVELQNMQNLIADKMYFVNAPNGLQSSEKNLRDDMYYAKAGVSASGNVNKIVKTNNSTTKISGDIDWVGVRTKYFALAIIPTSRKGTLATIYGEDTVSPKSSSIKLKKYSITLTMPFLGDTIVHDEYKVFFGPLDYDIIRKYQIKLEDFMDFGWKIIRPISLFILWSFKKLHSIISNYGIVLIIFSILIKIILWPLTHKSTKSMKEMQKLQPKIEEIRIKYGKDPARMNKETMKLYQEAGVNPMGSCLPMLLQMPLLYSLFIVFRSTIELRGAGFIGWIKDLSNPDTIAVLPFSIPIYGNSVNILPLIMGITMFFQQKMTSTDTKQKAMIYFMPIFLTLIFNSFPSGLTLYYTLFNILSIVEQKWLTSKINILSFLKN